VNIRRIFIPGRFQDAYLYRGWLIGLTQYRTLRFLQLATASENIASFLSAASEPSTPRTPSEFEHGSVIPYSGEEGPLDSQSIVIPRSWTEGDIQLNANIVLDLAVYKYRLYVGTDKGLFSAPLDLTDRRHQLQKQLQRRHDARALKVTTRFDAITVSCGEAGLFGALRESDSDRVSLQKIEDHSLKNAWLQSSLINYPSHRDWDVISTRQEVWAGGAERVRVTDFPVHARFGLDSLIGEIRRYEPRFQKEDVQFSFNSERYIFVHTFAGDFFSLRLGQRQGVPHVFFHRTYKGTDVRILSAAATAAGIVIETNKKVFLFYKERWFPLVNQEALSVRGFPRSLVFRDIVSICTEKGLHLIAAVPGRRISSDAQSQV
jgi:hypothetical protein